jgi:phosphate transport system permease protein
MPDEPQIEANPGELPPSGFDARAISRAPTSFEKYADRVFRCLCYAVTVGVILSVTFIVLTIAYRAMPAVREQGTAFLTGSVWDPNAETYGILPHIWGTFYSSSIALLFASVLGVSVAIFLSEGFLSGFVFRVLSLFGLQFKPFLRAIPDRLEHTFKTLVELLAAIPSVVYGLWGIFVVIPWIRPYCHWLHAHAGGFPLFGTDLSGPGLLPAALVLAIMVLPTITAIARDALVLVPQKIREASYGMGATRWQTLTTVVLPTASPGIVGGIILGFGRALGETMALAMLLGNANKISVSIFAPGNTLAALLANNFPEANRKEAGVLMYAALILLAITLLVNVAGNLVLQRANAKFAGRAK